MRRTWHLVAFTATSAVLIAGCGTSAAQSGGGKTSPLAIDAFNPFTGPDGSYGVIEISGCAPAVRLINQAGGVLGHHMQ